MSQIKTISIDQLVGELQQGAITEFWNVLTDQYFTGEMIPGSRRVPLDRIGKESTRAGLAKDTPIVVYCSSPDCPQSGKAAEKLGALGFTSVRAFEGGLEEWAASGRELVSEPAVASTAGA